MKDVTILTNGGVDVNSSLELFGDMEMYNATLNDFLTEVFNKVERIKKYKEEANMPSYAIEVHSLKSDSKYLGFTRLAELSYAHELKSKENDVMFVYEHFDELMAEASRIINLAKQYMGLSIENTITQDTNTIKEGTILVVDDSNMVSNFIKKIFDNKYDVIIANDGSEAIDVIEKDTGNNIKGMLLDLNMPNVDGFAVLEHLKNNNLFIKVPVSIITGTDTKETVDSAFAYPIVDYLIKPFNERDVKRIVERTVNFNC